MAFHHDEDYYRPKRSFGQGNIFTSVCLSTGGGACSKFSGGCLLQIFGGVPAPNFWGGPAPNFRGGCLLQIFGGVPAPNFRGGLLQISGGSPIFGIRSMFGRYTSYWNAFLLLIWWLPAARGDSCSVIRALS